MVALQTLAVVADRVVSEARSASDLGHREALGEQASDPNASACHERMFASAEDGIGPAASRLRWPQRLLGTKNLQFFSPGWCNWQHATLWMSNLGFESLSRSSV